MGVEALPRPASRHELGLLRFPDRATGWVVVLAATLEAPIAELAERLARLAAAVPLTSGRLHGETWMPGEPAIALDVSGDPVGTPMLDRHFDLSSEPPLRVVVGDGGHRVGLALHHAAFDGLAGVAILRALVDGAIPQPVVSPPPGSPGAKLPLLRRLFTPADIVAPSVPAPSDDAYASRVVGLAGAETTARIAEACAAAVASRAARMGSPWRRFGITVAIGGPPGVGNVASYRRVDLHPNDDVRAAVRAALASPAEPAEQVRAPKLLLQLLVPVVDRFSDTFLVSNLGRQEVPGVRSLEFYPVARGRSAVVFGAAGLAGGASTLSVRAARLSAADASGLLDEVVDRLEAAP